ncbi:MAG: sensor histidine kinase, partial [Hyphomicrobiales bacterium]
MQSLRTRLLVWLLVPLLAVTAIALTEANRNARQTANQVYDRLLAGSALAIAERVVVGADGALQVDVPYVALEMLISAAQDRVFYRVEGPGNGFITGYRDLSVPAGARQARPGGEAVFYDAVFRGATIRIAALAGAASGDRGTLTFEVLVAETTGARQALAGEMLVRAALRQSALIVVSLLVLWFGIARALRPLKRLEDAIGRRSSGELRPITWPVPVEVRHLVGAINDFMVRLDEGIAAMRRFTGNASHQLRTPLSVIKTQIALAEKAATADQANAMLESAGAAASDAERVVAQLLMLARLDEAAVGKTTRKTVDIVPVLRAITSELVPGAHRAGLDLGFDAQVEAAIIECDPILITEVIRNLVSNA